MAIEHIDLIVKAILEINPNAKYAIRGNDIQNIEWLENTTPIAAADIEAKIAQYPSAEEQNAQKETEKASGKQKLKDLGLTDAEIKALTGA
mgnify:CR=1 FL=1|jgi:hypothetical protein